MFIGGSIKKMLKIWYRVFTCFFKSNHTFYGQCYYFSFKLKNDKFLCQGKLSTFDKLRHRGTIRQRHSRHCPFQTERVISPALKYILSYSFLTIKQSCTDLFWKKSQILFVVVQVDMWDGALDETAIPRPLNSAC